MQPAVGPGEAGGGPEVLLGGRRGGRKSLRGIGEAGHGRSAAALAGAGRQAGGPLKMPARLGEVAVRVRQMPEAAGQRVTRAVWSRPGAGAERGPQIVGGCIEAGAPFGLNWPSGCLRPLLQGRR